MVEDIWNKLDNIEKKDKEKYLGIFKEVIKYV